MNGRISDFSGQQGKWHCDSDVPAPAVPKVPYGHSPHVLPWTPAQAVLRLNSVDGDKSVRKLKRKISLRCHQVWLVISGVGLGFLWFVIVCLFHFVFCFFCCCWLGFFWCFCLMGFCLFCGFFCFVLIIVFVSFDKYCLHVRCEYAWSDFKKSVKQHLNRPSALGFFPQKSPSFLQILPFQL